MAFGDGADFDLVKDISSKSHGFAKRNYESGRAFEQLENFYNEISDPKLQNVKFDYLVNGKKVKKDDLTQTKIEHVYGKIWKNIFLLFHVIM